MPLYGVAKILNVLFYCSHIVNYEVLVYNNFFIWYGNFMIRFLWNYKNK